MSKYNFLERRNNEDICLNPRIFIHILHVIKQGFPHLRQQNNKQTVQLLRLVDSAMQMKSEFTTPAKDLHYNTSASSYLKLTFPFNLDKTM